jgi:hypothetical protein
MFRTIKHALFLLVGIFISAQISAQNLPKTASLEENAFLDISFKSKNAFVDDVQIDEVTIKNPKNIRIVAVESIGQFPLHIAILIDTSGSQRRYSNELRRFYAEMLELLSLRPADSVSLVAVNNQIMVLQDSTFDKALLLKGFDKSRFYGNTRLSDAIYSASKSFGHPKNSRKMMIILSDGGDNGSTRTIQEAYLEAAANNIRVYMFAKEKEQGNNLPIWRKENGVWRREGGDHEKHIKITGGKVLSYSNLESAKEQLMQMMDEWNHLKRFSLFVDPPGNAISDLEISISRKGVKASNPPILQHTPGKSDYIQ